MAISVHLLVDDHEGWRKQDLLHSPKRPGLCVVAEVVDGVAAVQAAEEHKPDLILLDIGLPKLNGIQAARQIQQLSPNSKILFLSENRSRDIAEEALRTGAHAYLTKSSAGSELLLAIDEVLQGKQFVTAALVGPHLMVSKNEHTADLPDRKRAAPLRPVNVGIHHEVEFYADDAGFVDQFARLTKIVLGVGNAVVLLATDPYRTAVLEKLRRDGIDVDAVVKQGRFVLLGAGETLNCSEEKVSLAGFAGL